MKFNYSSYSKFADWLRGTPKPLAGTTEETNKIFPNSVLSAHHQNVLTRNDPVNTQTSQAAHRGT